LPPPVDPISVVFVVLLEDVVRDGDVVGAVLDVEEPVVPLHVLAIERRRSSVSMCTPSLNVQ